MRTPCAARTQSGKQCKNLAVAGSQYCRLHQPLAHPVTESRGEERAKPTSKGVAGEKTKASERSMRQQLVAELDRLTRRAQMVPDYVPNYVPDYAPGRSPDHAPAEADWQPELDFPAAPSGGLVKNRRDLYDEPGNEKPLVLSWFDIALVGAGAFFAFRWLLRRRRNDK